MTAIDVVLRRPGVPAAARGPLTHFTQQVLAKALEAIGRRHAGLTVLYCSGAEIRRLNHEFRSIDKETDVLSFPEQEDPAADLEYLGDIAVCLKVCRAQAALHGRRTADETALLLVHGLLHLAGWDHETPAKEEAMWAETDRILARCRHLPRPHLDAGQ